MTSTYITNAAILAAVNSLSNYTKKHELAMISDRRESD
jgi:hypothetical protein